MKSTLKRRQEFLPQYRELFKVLFKIGDSEVVNRVVSAINGNNICPQCIQNQQLESVKPECVNISTQTDEENTTAVGNDKDNDTSSTRSDGQLKREVKRRKRKRKIPEAIKSSPSAEEPERIHLKLEQQTSTSKPPPTLQRKLSIAASDIDFSSILDLDLLDDSALLQAIPIFNTRTKQDVLKQMEFEWSKCDELGDDGFLRIHRAVRDNNEHLLLRQLFVLGYRKINFNELYTSDNESIIEIALKSNCYPKIIKSLLDWKVDLSVKDEESNTVLHMLLLHVKEDAAEILKMVLPHCDVSVLTATNDVGFTPLHIAVRNNRFRCLAIILNDLDSKLGVKRLQSPPENTLKTDADCLQFYADELKSLGSRDREFNSRKAAILNMKDVKNGRTALYHAVDLKLYHIVYLLLNHLADPTIKDYSGADAQSHDTEYGTNKSVSLGIQTTVDFLLNCQ